MPLVRNLCWQNDDRRGITALISNTTEVGQRRRRRGRKYSAPRDGCARDYRRRRRNADPFPLACHGSRRRKSPQRLFDGREIVEADDVAVAPLQRVGAGASDPQRDVRR